MTAKEIKRTLQSEFVRTRRKPFVDAVKAYELVKPGDKVIYSKYSGTEVKVEEEDYIIVKQNDILAVIE